MNNCNCCDGLSAEIPAQLFNRPGLNAIAYRIGTHSRFKESLLALMRHHAPRDSIGSMRDDASLTTIGLPALRDLKTREDDDFSIALLDAWATVADVLTFYQERIANENYLRTATERLSLRELARLIGYKLRPGVAASTYLAFTLETAPGAPESTTIEIGTRVQSIPGPGEQAQSFETIEKITARRAWNALTPQQTKFVYPKFGDTAVYVEGLNTNLQAGDVLLFLGSEREKNSGNEQWDFRRITRVDGDAANNRTRAAWREPLGSTKPFVKPAAQPKIYALRQRANVFGYNAPDWRLLANSTKANYLGKNESDLTAADKAEWKDFVIYTPAQRGLPAGQRDTIDLDQVYPSIVAGSWLILALPSYTEVYRVVSAVEAARAEYGISSKVTRVELSGENLELFNDVRNVTVFAASQELAQVARPITDDLFGAAFTLAQRVDDLSAGQALLVSGTDVESGARVAESVTIQRTERDDDVTRVILATALQHRYLRGSVTISANVALATHGETTREILGSGDASKPYQQFTLKQSPLTYISAANENGAASTLDVFVNDVRWHETETLFQKNPRDRVFVTRVSEDGKTTVQFGDGKTGARPPTGTGNLRATYRKGIGQAGNVNAGQLSLLLTRPLGVKEVTNPLAANGGADAETLKSARANAPLTVLTLGRIVSLRDYEDFARSFAGVAKALATWTWDGQTRGVFVTIAGADGATISQDSATYKNLLAAMKNAGDPYVPLRVQTFRPARFTLDASVKIDSDFESDIVLKQVEQTLRAEFSFDARAFGQPIALSQIVSAMHSVQGVVGVDVNALYRVGEPKRLRARLAAAYPRAGADGNVDAAELLMLDASPLELNLMP